MKKTSRLTLLMLLAAGSLAFLAVGCNEATDDPVVSDARLLVATVTPQVACADVDGKLEDLDGDGTDEHVFYDYNQNFTFQSRVTGAVDQQGSVWNDAHLDSVQLTYILDAGSLASRTIPLDTTVPANGSVQHELLTVPAPYSSSFWFGGSNEGISTLGKVVAVFRGVDAGGERVSVSTELPFGTYNACED